MAQSKLAIFQPGPDRGTPEWAAQCREDMRTALNAERKGAIRFNTERMIFMEEKGWTLIQDDGGEPFKDFRTFALAAHPPGLGMGKAQYGVFCDAYAKTRDDYVEDAKKDPLDTWGDESRFKPESAQGSVSTLEGKRDATYLARRLKRSYPDIFKRLEAGEFPSVRAAAMEAGIVKDPTPLQILKRTWPKTSDDERNEFLKWTADN